MSQEQSFLSPDQQNQLYQKMKAAGLLSQDVGQSTTTPDTEAQSGIGNMDFNTLQSMIKHANNPNAVPMQEGDQSHPMDAIHSIGSTMFGPQSPSGIEFTGGPQVINKNGQQMLNVITKAPLGRLLGIHEPTPLPGPNYYHAAKAAGIDKFLGTGLPQMPDGTPYVDKETYNEAKMTGAYGLNADKEKNKTVNYTTPGQLTAASDGRISETAAKNMLTQFGGTVPDVVLQRALSGDKTGVMQATAEFRKQQVQNAALNTYLKYSGAGLAQKAGAESITRLVNLQRAQAIANQIDANGGKADVRQRTEFASSIARAINPTGVLTNEALNLYIPDSLKGKFGNFSEYVTNSRTPVDFTGFLPAMQDLLTREVDVNKGVLSNITQFSDPALKNLMNVNPSVAKSASATANNNPLVPPPTPTTPSNGTWRVIR